MTKRNETPLKRFQRLAGRIEYKDWTIHVRSTGARWYLQVSFLAPDAQSGKQTMQVGRKWLLSQHMTDTEVVVTAFKACLGAEEHECREFFKYRGQPVFNVHTDVNWLADQMAAADRSEVRKEKPES